MNGLEAEFYEELKREHGSICIQAMRFKLGNGIWYKPDFVCDGVHCYEVKGPHSFRGGFENLKVAASLYTMFKWCLVWKDDGEWREQEVLP